jgi:hypothetical protein
VRNSWSKKASCLGLDTNLFFDTYETNKDVAISVDTMCAKCPVQRKCLAQGVGNKEWGVWGGIYLEGGEISKEFNQHKNSSDWFEIWSGAMIDTE